MTSLPFPGYAWSAKTDIGKCRRRNEDAFLALPEVGLWAVADGMGGESDGHLASQWTVEALRNAFPDPRPEPQSIRRTAIRNALLTANRRILDHIREHGLRAMGSTVALLLLDPQFPDRADLCTLGDSRIYALEDGRPRQLTRDHTVANELPTAHALAPQMRSLLTRALGMQKPLRPEWRRVALCPGNTLFLCTDGTYAALKGTSTPWPVDPEALTDALIARVLQTPATDNATALALRVPDPLPAPIAFSPEELAEGDYLEKTANQEP